MPILDDEPMNSFQPNHRVFGVLDGDAINVAWGLPDGNGMPLPNGQTTLRLSVQKVLDLIGRPSAGVPVTESDTPATPSVRQAQDAVVTPPPPPPPPPAPSSPTPPPAPAGFDWSAIPVETPVAPPSADSGSPNG